VSDLLEAQRAAHQQTHALPRALAHFLPLAPWRGTPESGKGMLDRRLGAFSLLPFVGAMGHGTGLGTDAGRGLEAARAAEGVASAASSTEDLAAAENVRAFAHGASKAYAEDIASNGLDTDAARAASRGGRVNSPGSLFTHEIGPPANPGPGFQLAYEWGLRHSDQPVVLIAKLPESVYLDLERQGPVTVERFPGATESSPLQTVFSAESFSNMNQHAIWQIFDPYAGLR